MVDSKGLVKRQVVDLYGKSAVGVRPLNGSPLIDNHSRSVNAARLPPPRVGLTTIQQSMAVGRENRHRDNPSFAVINRRHGAVSSGIERLREPDMRFVI